MFRPLNLVDINNAESIRDGDELRNINSFEYLFEIARKIVLNDPKDHPTIDIYTPRLCAPPIKTENFSYDLKPYQIFNDLKETFSQHEYDENNDPLYESQYAYGNLYTSFFDTLEIAIPEIEKHREAMISQCIFLGLEIFQNTTLLRFLEQKIITLKADIGYYEANKDKIDEASLKIIKNDLSNREEKVKRLEKSMEINNASIEAIKEFSNNFDQMIDTIYLNPNQGLERAANMIENVIAGVRQTSANFEAVITERLKGKSESKPDHLSNSINYYTGYRDVNKITPQDAGSLLHLVIGGVSPSFKPLKHTSMPSIRTYEYKKMADEGTYPLECRMGTQAQYHHGTPRITPIFEAWLRVQKRKREAQGQKKGQTRITHIYFNNLPLDRESSRGNREVMLSHQLHELEKRHDNIAVITLPADQGIMNHHFVEHHQKSMTLKNAFARMLKISNGTSPEKIKDFYISDAIKKLLYGDGDPYNEAKEAEILPELIAKSFRALGLSKGSELSEADLAQELSEAELQAVYFHFIKFELTDFIISKLNPDSFNMSCKDGIDRAGVSSAYYNLMKSIEANHPLDQKEFIRALHGAPTLVKGRGINHHSRLIWNAIDGYINANKNSETIEIPSWLVNWRNENAPEHTKEYYINELKIFIATHEKTKELGTLSLFKNDSVISAKKMLILIENDNAANDSNVNSVILADDNEDKDVNFNSPFIDLTINELNDKELIKLRADMEKDNLFDFRPYIMSETANVTCCNTIGF